MGKHGQFPSELCSRRAGLLTLALDCVGGTRRASRTELDCVKNDIMLQ